MRARNTEKKLNVNHIAIKLHWKLNQSRYVKY